MKTSAFYAVDEQGKKYPYIQREEGRSLFLTLPKENLVGVKKLRLLPEVGCAKAGEAGYWILPRTIAMTGEIQTFFIPREDMEYTYVQPLMSWYGIKKSDYCCMIRITRNYNYHMCAGVAKGVYTVTPMIDFKEYDDAYADINLEIVSLDLGADYNDMAKTEREIRLSRGELETLAERCKRPAVEYARKYPLVRIRNGWKQSPSPVTYQTEENEPPMFVACDFKRVRDIADELKRQGVVGAELQLVGWNKSGHDGRYPQIFPAEPLLGGNEALRETINYVKSLGYRISTHTCTIDSYTLGNTFTWEDIAVDRKGEYKQIGHHCGGYAFRVCMHKQLKNARRDFPELAAYNPNGVHYNDVTSILLPEDCHAADHPCTTAEGIEITMELMNYIRELFGAFSSEGCLDYTLRYLDFGLYVSMGSGFDPASVPIADAFLPVWEVTYHGITLYNPLSVTVNYTAQPRADRLALILRGGKPAMYFHSKFRSGGEKNWMGENDLSAITEEDLQRSIAFVRTAAEEYAPLADLQLVYLKRYDVLENHIEVATYENGTRIVGNFSDSEQSFEGRTVAPWDYLVI